MLEPLEGRLDDQGQTQLGQPLLSVGVVAGEHGPGWGRHAGGRHQALGTILVERDSQRQRIRAGIGNAQHLEHGRHAGLARASAAGPLGKVEHQVRPRAFEQAVQQRLAVAEQIDLVAQALEHLGNRLHGFQGVEFFVLVPQASQAERS